MIISCGAGGFSLYMDLKGINQPVDVNTLPPGTKLLRNGAIADIKTGRIITTPGGGNKAITKQNSGELQRLRREKAAAALRARLVESYNGVMPSPARSSADVFAGAGAMLFEEIVLNSEAYARDRLETWKELGKAAGVLADPRAAEAPGGSIAGAAELTGALASLVQGLAGFLSGQAEVPLHASPGEIIEGEAS